MSAPPLSSATSSVADHEQEAASERAARESLVAPLPWTRADALALLALAALVAVLMGLALLGRAGFPLGDFFDQFYAFDRFAASELAAGRLPLWNPYTFSGHPFLADIQSGVFYPPNLVMLLASALRGGDLPIRALYLQVALHLFLAGACTYAFARRRLGQRLAALLAAVVFASGGYLTSYPPLQLAVLQTDAWLPLLLLLIDSSLGASRQRETRQGILLASLVWAMVLLAGHPQSAMYVGYAALAWGVYRAWRAGVGWWRGGVIVAVSALVGLLLAAAQWLPSIEYARLSVRAAASYDKLAHGFPFRDLVSLVLPGIVSLWSPLYVGILPLILAVYALRRSWRAYDTAFWAGLGGMSLLLSFGGGLFVYPLFYWLAPGFNIFQGQERAAFLAAFALAMLAGIGFVTQRRKDAKAQTSDMYSSAALRLCGALFLVGLGIAVVAGVWAWRGPIAGGGRDELWALARAGAGLCLFAALAFAWLRRPVERRWWAALGIALVAVDLARVAFPLLAGPVPPADLGYPSALVGPLQDAGTTRVENEYRLPANYGILKGVEDTWGASPLRTQRYADFYAAVPPERRRRLLNVGSFLTWHNDVPGMTEVARLPVVNPATGAKETTYLLKTEAGPRAWLVGAVEVVDDAEALARLADGAFDPWQTALVAPEAAALLATDGKQINGWVSIGCHCEISTPCDGVRRHENTANLSLRAGAKQSPALATDGLSGYGVTITHRGIASSAGGYRPPPPVLAMTVCPVYSEQGDDRTRRQFINGGGLRVSSAGVSDARVGDCFAPLAMTDRTGVSDARAGDCFAPLAMTDRTGVSDARAGDCFAPLAMTDKTQIASQPTYRQLAPGHVAVDVTADAPALLALSEVWYPGWQAAVDGAPAPLLRAYDTLMAVPVPAGAHTVELRFDPPLVKIGLAVSGISLALVVLGLVWTRWRRA